MLGLGVSAYEAIHLICIFSIHFSLGEHRKFSVVTFLCELFDLKVRAGLLTAELIAGEGKYFETLVPILLVQLCQQPVFLCSQSSLRRNVDEHDHLFLLHELSKFD